ncbi:MAG TPA: TPM domain-containing protein [Gammaproteobacteria bacterium]
MLWIQSIRQYWPVLLLLCLSVYVQAAPEFPELSGRVVDNANLLSGAEERELTEILAGHEQETSNQLVIVTVPGLQGYSIEDFGYQLGRHWGIGQEGRDNGVLLIVAPTERKVRIEVGYGLEHALTDAISHNIIQNVILPQFKEQKFNQGIKQGVNAILSAIKGTYEPISKKKQQDVNNIILPLVIVMIVFGEILNFRMKSRMDSSSVLGITTFVLVWIITGAFLVALFNAFLVVMFHFFIGGSSGKGGGSGYTGGYTGGYSSGGYSSGSFGGGGGFSGGGGGFGGGGASGGW